MTLGAAPARVLVVQTSLLGDLVLATPVFGSLRRRWPEAHIAALVRPEGASILGGHPDVDETIVDDKRGRHRGALGLLRLTGQLRVRRFDVAISLHRATRTALILALAEIPLRVGFRQSEVPVLYHRRVWRDPAQHDIDRQLSILSPLGFTPRTEAMMPRLGVTPAARRAVDTVLAQAGVAADASYVVLAPGSSWHSKQWMPGKFGALGRALVAAGEVVVFVGAAAESEMIADVRRQAGGGINLAGQTSAGELAAVIARASATICNDSAPMHIAQAFGVPLVAIVGPTSPAQGFMPIAPRSIVVSAPVPCRPTCRFGGLDCPLGTQACFHLVTPEQVIEALTAVRASADPAEADVRFLRRDASR